MDRMKALKWGLVAVAGVGLSACSSIRETRGYIVDQVLVESVAPGIDNRQSVEGALGRPTYVSEYGEKTWYYISNTTSRKPFVRPRAKDQTVLAVTFDEAGNVASVNRSGMENVVFLSPDGDETPTLGRERGFLEDLFGNIGQVGAGGAAPAGGV